MKVLVPFKADPLDVVVTTNKACVRRVLPSALSQSGVCLQGRTSHMPNTSQSLSQGVNTQFVSKGRLQFYTSFVGWGGFTLVALSVYNFQ